jgi:hypothetical protein
MGTMWTLRAGLLRLSICTALKWSHPQMDTPIILTMVFLSSTWISEVICLKGGRWRAPILSLTTCGLLLGCFIAQLSFPELLILFSREATRILAGDWWRLVTALFFQHGGLIGGLTNIATLFWIGDLAPASFYQIDACSARGLAAVEATARPVVVRLLLRTRIVPPCLSTIAFETERPSPVPRSFLVVK